MSYTWFKVHSRGWLTGTIRDNMTIEERSVWTDLLAMASESRVRGVICRAEGVPYTREYMASFLGVPVDLLNSTITKCMADKNAQDEQHRIEIDATGCIHIANWGKYQSVPSGKSAQDKQECRRRANANYRDKQTSLDALRREVNRLNKAVTTVGKNLRYVAQDGRILDTQTGEVMQPEGDTP